MVRRGRRLPGYDYAADGGYFITTTTKGRSQVFGRIRRERMILSVPGMILQAVWYGLPHHYPHVVLDAAVIMPDHFHGIIWLRGTQSDSSSNRHALPEIVRALKSFSARRINEVCGTPGRSIWQRDYYERIVRSDQALEAIREYIRKNPVRW